MTNEQENTVSTAILVDPGLDTPLSPVLGELPIALLPVATKPLLQHWLERISAMGTQRVTILSAHFPEKVRQFVADGSRWGLAVEVVVYRPEMDAQGLRALLADISGTDPTLVANLATWPMPELAQYLTPAARVEGQDESAMCWQINARPFVEKLELDHNDRPVVTVPADAYQDCNDLEGYWQLNMRLLSGELYDPLPYGFEAAPGVWAASNCKLDSSVSILGSVVIGESAIVARRALLGHNAVIGAHSVVEQGASIVDSVVFPRSFIGSYMQIGEAIVAGDVIYRVADGLLLHVNDPEIVARRERLNSAVSLGQRLAAVSLLGALLVPLLLAMALLLAKGRKALVREQWWYEAGFDFSGERLFSSLEMLTLNTNHSHWRRVPWLLTVAAGALPLVGTSLRLKSEFHYPEWVNAAEHFSPGMISLALLDNIDPSSPENIVVADALQLAQDRVGFDIKMMGRWILGLMRF